MANGAGGTSRERDRERVDVEGLFAAVVEHAGWDLGSMTRAALQGELSLLGQASSWIAARRARVLRALSDLDVPGTSPEHDAAAATKSSLSAANHEMKRAGTLGQVPEMEEALESGDVSPEHVDRLSHALDRLGDRRDELAADGDALAALAARTTPEQFGRKLNERIARMDERDEVDRLARQRRANQLRIWTDQVTGMLRASGHFDPESGLLFVGRIEAMVEAMFHGGVPPECPEGEHRDDWLRAMALLRLVTGANMSWCSDEAAADQVGGAQTGGARAGGDHAAGGHAGGGLAGGGPAGGGPAGGGPAGDAPGPADPFITAGDHAEIIVVIDLQTLLHGLHQRSVVDPGHDLHLPIASYRRMACTAAIIPAVMGGDGVLLDLGRAQRLANRAQRRALRAMYRHCGIPGCTVSIRHCQPHHVRWWGRDLGPTDLSNLVPLCSHHHHMVHEGGWQLVLHADRSLTITHPDGTLRSTGPPGRDVAA